MSERKVPKIRFPGFTGEWEELALTDTFDFLQNNTLSRAELNSEDGIAKNVHYGDILVKFGELLDVSKEVLPYIDSHEIVDKFMRSFLRDGDIVMADTAEDETVGKCSEIAGVSDYPVISGLHTIPLRPKNEYAPGYLGYYMNSKAYHDQLFPLMQGIKVTSVSKGALQKTSVTFPTDYSEQAAIGSAFILLDKIIAQLQGEQQKMKELKKGMLQKMFPKEGESVPEIRFPGFSMSWNRQKLSNFGNATGGTAIESEFSIDGIYKVISIGSYSEESTYRDQGIRAKRSTKTMQRILNKDDLTMILNDKTAEGNIIGRVLLIEHSNEYVYNQRTERIEVNKELYDPVFLYEMLNAPCVREKIINHSQGNTQIYVNWSTISQIEYLVPNLEEQKVIGQFLSRFSQALLKMHEEIEKLKELKRGLLQQMFVA